MIEYRVISRYYNATLNRTQHTIRQEGPFDTLDAARAFAASFTPPKFEGAHVESREVSPWRKV